MHDGCPQDLVHANPIRARTWMLVLMLYLEALKMLATEISVFCLSLALSRSAASTACCAARAFPLARVVDGSFAPLWNSAQKDASSPSVRIRLCGMQVANVSRCMRISSTWFGRHGPTTLRQTERSCA